MRDLICTWLIARSTFGRKLVSLAAFAAGAAFFHALVAVSFPAIGGMDAVQSVVRTFPSGLRTLLKIAPNLQAAFGLQDYLAFSWFHPVFLGLGAAFVVARAVDALTGEIERGSIYLVLSRPAPRWSLVAGKALEMFAGAAAIALAAWLGLAAGATVTLDTPLPLDRYLMVVPMAAALFAALGAGALIISSLASRTGLAGGLAVAWTLISFVLDVIPAVATSPLAWLNPWHYYFPQAIVATGRLDLGELAILLIWAAAATAIASGCFMRRDLV